MQPLLPLQLLHPSLCIVLNLRATLRLFPLFKPTQPPTLLSPSLPESLPRLEWTDPEPAGAPRLGWEASTVW